MTAGRSSRRSAAGLSAAQVGSLLAPQGRLLAAVAAGVLAGAALEVLPPLLVRQAVDAHLAVGRAAGLVPLGLLYLLVAAGQQGLGFASAYGTAIAAQRALRDLRVRLFAHLQRLPARYFDTNSLGDTVSRCTADIDTIDRLFSSGIASLVGDLVRLVTITLTMLVLSPALTLLCGLAVPPLLWFTRWFQVRVLAAERASRAAVGGVNTALVETLGGAEVIRAFGQTGFFEHRFRGALQATQDAYLAATRYSAIYTPLMAILASLVVCGLLWAGAEGALAGWGVSIGTLTAFVLLFRRFFAPITTLGEEWQTVQGALSGAERVFQVLALPAEEAPADDATPGATGEPEPLIELKDVVFGYLDDRPVLHRVSFVVRAGEHVALVGRTGAGKSSLMHLAGGLYAPWSGAIRVAGADPRALTDESRRERLGVVPQTLQLFSGTVLDNLTMGDPRATRAAAESAARATGAHAFIQALPRGYDTPLAAGEAGAALSAGQRQLLALTRALVRQPRVLLLDEATAAIDHASDAAFRAALRRDAHDSSRAVLIVAHRLSTAREADRVIVIEDGRILEQGAPGDLVRRQGRFAALLAMEAAGWDWHQR
jgi:ATP-binding cassette subfamily B multidrug efflux pump